MPRDRPRRVRLLLNQNWLDDTLGYLRLRRRSDAVEACLIAYFERQDPVYPLRFVQCPGEAAAALVPGRCVVIAHRGKLRRLHPGRPADVLLAAKLAAKEQDMRTRAGMGDVRAGRVVSADLVRAWATSLGDGLETAPPKNQEEE